VRVGQHPRVDHPIGVERDAVAKREGLEQQRERPAAEAEQVEEILGVTVRKVVIPVAAGRNLAVLLEAAVRNYILQLRGIHSSAEFLARQKRAMDAGD